MKKLAVFLFTLLFISVVGSSVALSNEQSPESVESDELVAAVGSIVFDWAGNPMSTEPKYPPSEVDAQLASAWSNEVWVEHTSPEWKAQIAEMTRHIPEDISELKARHDAALEAQMPGMKYTVNEQGQYVPVTGDAATGEDAASADFLPAVWVTNVKGPYVPNGSEGYLPPSTLVYSHVASGAHYRGTLTQYYEGFEKVNGIWYGFALYEGWTYYVGPLSP